MIASDARQRMLADLHEQFPEIKFTNTIDNLLEVAWLDGQLFELNKQLARQDAHHCQPGQDYQ